MKPGKLLQMRIVTFKVCPFKIKNFQALSMACFNRIAPSPDPEIVQVYALWWKNGVCQECRCVLSKICSCIEPVFSLIEAGYTQACMYLNAFFYSAINF